MSAATTPLEPLRQRRQTLRPLTDRQRAVLDFIVEFSSNHGFPPTVREIALRMGIRSTNGVSDHLSALERKGFISRSEMASRGIRVLVNASEQPHVDVHALAVQGYRAENAALRALLHRAETAGRRLPQLTAEMVVALGDIRSALNTRST